MDHVDLGATVGFLRDAKSGNEAARGQLLERLRPRVVLWVASRLSPALRAQVEAEDVAQDILLAVHKGIDGFEGDEPRAFFGWLFRVAENRIRDLADHFQAQKRQPVLRFSFSQTSPSAAAARTEQLVRVREAIAALPDDYRRVIQLRRLEGLESGEVAAILGRSENAVRILYCRALRALRGTMDAPGASRV